MVQPNYQKLLETAINAALPAGEKIIEVYNQSDFNVEYKADNSPLTIADKYSHSIICNFLEETSFPILSEEGKNIDYSARKQWNRLWLVDPLDGTKEFIKRNGEFTVNIAFIEDKKPVTGVIYVPVTGELLFAGKDTGAYKVNSVNTLPKKINLDSLISRAQKLPLAQTERPYRIIGSRSHKSAETEEFMSEIKKQHKNVEIISRGSSLKLCMIAEGNADIYPRYAPTMEWDTAAGHAIILGSGGIVTQKNGIDPLEYNKENLLNPWFVAKTDSEIKK